MHAMLVAVTGPSGHLGANLVRVLLRRGYRVRALVHQNTRAIDGLPVEKVAADILNAESLQKAFVGVDVVFHLAARISIVNSDRQQVEAMNIFGVRHVVEACLTSGVKRLVHVSSIHAHQQEPKQQQLDETRPLVGSYRSFSYDHSKAEGEIIVRQAIRNGLNAIIINPTGIIGPYDYQPSHLGSALLMIANRKMPMGIGGGFDWVDARDVADGIVRAAETASAGGKYLLSGHWVSMKNVAREVCNVLNMKPPSFILPIWGARCVVPLVTAYCTITDTRPLFTRAAIGALDSNHNISHARAGRTFGYQPRPFNETITDTLTWFKKNGYIKQG
jgi:dihydroflavonol-4-reductase